MLFCQNCGNGNNTNHPICAHCGNRILYSEMTPGVPKKRKKKTLLILGVIIGIIVAAVAFALFALRGMQTNPEINLGNDTIPSIYAVVGERRVIGVSREWSTDERSITITYQERSISSADIELYIETLLTDYDFIKLEDIFGIIILASESAERNRSLIIEIRFHEHRETIITYIQREGRLTR